MTNKVIVNKGKNGWGGPLVLEPSDQRQVVASITGGGIHPVAQKIADILGVDAHDGFKEKVDPEMMICAVIDCGGTARCGVYPKLNVMTVNVHATTPSGPLMKFINEENFVSGVTVHDVAVTEGNVETTASAKPVQSGSPTKEEYAAAKQKVQAAKDEVAEKQGGLLGFINRLGRAVGRVVSIFYQAGRDTFEIVIKNILPFMAFVSMLVGLITYTGIGDVIASGVKPLSGNIIGLIILSLICSIPVLSPVLGPGAVIAQVVGVLLGVEIGKGSISPAMALPALFAINSQAGADFVPVGLTLAEAEPYTVEIGVPAVLFSRLLTGPVSVILAWLASFGMY
ncbi:PTS glucitol/sorbitol transporter subunit IIB [Enterococcus olivae]